MSLLRGFAALFILFVLTGCWAEIGGGPAISTLRSNGTGAAIELHTGLVNRNRDTIVGGLFGGSARLRLTEGYKSYEMGPSGFVGWSPGSFGFRLHLGLSMAPLASHRGRAAFSPLGSFAEINTLICSQRCFKNKADQGLLSVGLGIDHRFVFRYANLDPHQESFVYLRVGVGSFESFFK